MYTIEAKEVCFITLYKLWSSVERYDFVWLLKLKQNMYPVLFTNFG